MEYALFGLKCDDCGYESNPLDLERIEARVSLVAVGWAMTDAVDILNAQIAKRDARIAKLEAALSNEVAKVLHYEGWFGTECRCDDDECPL